MDGRADVHRPENDATVRVLLVIHDFLPANRAGSELYTYYLARELVRSGLEVELFFSEGSTTPRVERRLYDGLPCTVVLKRRGNPFDVLAEPDVFVEHAFGECLDRLRPDLVHINHLLFLSLMLPAIAKSRNIPVVFTLHDYWLSCPRVTRLDHHGRPCTAMTPLKCTLCCRELYSRFSPARRPDPAGAARRGARLAYSVGVEVPAAYAALRRRSREIRPLAKTVDFWISPSRFLRDLMGTFGLPRERILHLPNGLPLAHLQTAGRSPRGGRLHFGYLGTINRHKGIHVLLEAFRGLEAADLTIWGGPPGYLAVDYGDVLAQRNVRFPGRIDDEQKASVFASIDALVVPSIWFENAPLVILEALLSGVPVIASDIGGMRELIRDGETGFHFPAGSVADLRRLLLSCIQDPSRLRSLKPSSLDVTSMEDHARAILSLYQRILPAPAP
jgi:glycosyltransferase involved in cell wall biosynthesis